MLTEEKRLLRMLYLMSNAESYQKASNLAKQLQVSERTVKKNVEQLKKLAEKNGCRVESVRGKGYILKVEDLECFGQVRESLLSMFCNTEKGDKENPVYRISRSLMVQEGADKDGYFRLEDLAETLYISESDMKKKMANVREFLGTFRLTLQSRPGKGMRLEGDELSRRLCFLELYENHFRKHVVTFQNQRYESAFADRGDKEQIRSALLWIIRDSELEMFDSFLNRLINYVLLMRNRMKAGHYMAAADSQWGQYQAEIRASREYGIAEQIIQSLKCFAEFQEDCHETAALCVLLQMWADLEAENRPEQYFPEIYEKAYAASKELIQALDEEWKLPWIQRDDACAHTLIPGLLRIFLHARYGYSQTQTVGDIVSDNGIKGSVLSMALADWAAEMIRKKWDIVINEYSVQLLAVRFFRLIQGGAYPYVPRRLLICARNGKESARIISDAITSRLGTWWIGKMTITELYEGRKYPVEDYDCFIGSIRSYAYRYQWPYIEVKQVPGAGDFGRIRREVLLKGYDLESIKRRCRWDVFWIHRDFAGGQMEGIFQLIAWQWGKSPEAKEELTRHFAQKGTARIHRHILTLLIPEHRTGKRILEMYILRKPISYLDKSVRIVVFAAVDFERDPEILRYLEDFLRMLTIHVEEVKKEADSDKLMEILTEKIRDEL